MEIFVRYRIYFRLAPLWLWPSIWWQLTRIRRYTAQTGRKVLFTFTPRWKLKINYIADGPDNPRLYRYAAPITPVWTRPSLSTNMPGFLLEATAPMTDDARLSSRAAPRRASACHDLNSVHALARAIPP